MATTPTKSFNTDMRSGISSKEILAATSQNTFIKLPIVKKRTSLSTSEIYRRIEAGTFPTQIKLGAKSVAWLEHEINDWISQAIAQGRADEVA